MESGVSLLDTLIISLAAAGIAGIMAVFLRQPLVVGYVLAGMAIGPYTPGLVADATAVDQLAEFGIVLLMFAIGVQLTFQDLLRVGPVALIGGLAQVSVTVLAGYGVASLLGWPPLAGLAFGFVVSNSSSTVLTKVLGEYGEQDSTHGRIALAWSSVQDLTSVLMVVLLFGLGGTASNASIGLELAKAIGLTALFIGLLIPIGMAVIPRLLEYLAAMSNREVFVLATAGIALVIAYTGSVFGLSPALGAFLAGMLVARSDLAHHVLGEITPLRDMFAALFFIGVGMLVDPTLLLDEFWMVAVTVLMIVAFKSVVAGGITLIAGYRAKTAVLTGVILGQSAEFSFLIARVGADAGVLTETTFGVLLLGTALSILVVPVVYRVGIPLGAWLEPRLAAKPRDDEDDGVEVPLVDHAILLGYGRVGRVIADALQAATRPVVVVEQERALVLALRGQGHYALFGSASNRVVLDRAGLSRASLLVVAVPDPIAVRRIVDYAREVNPEIDIVVRTHSAAERRYLEERGVNEAVMGEMELAVEMSRHALLRFGLNIEEAEHVLVRLRAAEI
ncbi:MAG: cation:proton antiporter [Dehalococcoidia bacterium]